MIDQLVAFFANPATRFRAYGAVTVLGIVVALLVAFGVTAAVRGGSNDPETESAAAPPSPTTSAMLEATERSSSTGTLTATPTASPTASATPTRTPTEAATATSTPTPTPSGRRGSGSTAANPTATPTPVPATPTTGPAVSNLAFCDSSSSTAPPTAVFGRLTIGGAKVPAGTTATLLFDGVAGYSASTREPGGYRVDYWAGSSDCANRVGAEISVMVNGQAFPTGRSIGDGGGPVIVLHIALP